MAMLPNDPLTEVTRGASFRLNLGNFEHVDFFCSQKMQCYASRAHETSETVHSFCLDEVMKAINDFREQRGYAPVDFPERGDASDAAFQRQAQINREKEESPFIVTERPKTQPEPPAQKPEPEKIQTGPETVADTKAAAPEPPAKRRGKQPAPTPEQAKDQLKASVGPQLVKPGEFKASDEDLPAALGGPVLSRLERVQAVDAQLSKATKRDIDACKRAVRTYLKAFLGKDTLPVPDSAEGAIFGPVLPILESMVRLYPDDLATDPTKFGKDAGDGWRQFTEMLTGSAIMDKAIEVGIAKYPDSGGFELIDYMRLAKISDLDAVEVNTFLAVFGITRDAIKFRESSAKSGVPMSKMVEGLDLSRATEADIVARIK